MGRFKSEGIIVRRVNDIEIIFYDKHTIYVYPDRGFGCIFSRWCAPRGDYMSNWNPFRRKLMRYKNLSITRCCSLADYHEIMARSTDKKINLKGRKVIRR